MTVVGTVGMLGLGTMLVGELRGGRSPQPGLVSASLVSTAVASSMLAIVVLLVMYIGHLKTFDVTDVLIDVLFVLGAALTGVSFVLDLALIGLGAGPLQLARNSVFALVKWLLLYTLLPVISRDSAGGVLAAWVVGLAVSFAVLALPTATTLRTLVARPDWATLRSLRGATSAHNAFNLAGQVPRLLLPVMATTVISPSAGAAFFIAWMIAGFLYVIPTHLSTALFAIGAGRLDELAEKLRFSFRLSLAFGIIAGPVLAILAPQLLRIFGADYSASGTASLQLLTIAYVPMAIKTHYIAVMRVQGRLRQGSFVAVTGALFELVGAAVGARLYGINGLTIGVLVGLTIEAAIMSPTLLRAGPSIFFRHASRAGRAGLGEDVNAPSDL
ncbi:O-antigen/teichoic acid export membrane protein [Geodermatophilus bullaregiensis]|uniref:MATE family efflux transporter n=1 Tax=Geodermatophilus bullaregiensis TaxID=1564160 RepID=UPI00195DABBF|nr:MATE family efflux transporter [Geodermatophilus bullaregiensis]MBM7806968.1 O-antigen/teichoic acid export membrane protein [Geodermatophilus bullaregiensis]